MIWGGRRLATELNKTLPTPVPYGESWEVSDHFSHSSVVAVGPLAGFTLRSLMEQRPGDIVGRARSASERNVFPWLIKFLDAHDWLSVQVHPDDDKVQRLCPGESGKTEAWFVLSAEPTSRIFAGLLPGVGPEDFRQTLVHGHVTNLMHAFTPRPGDFVFLPAGTVHALGGGVLLIEVQQTSDATFRLFDWNRVDAAGRPRQLHVDEGLAAVDWSRGPALPIHVPLAGDNDILQPLVRCPYFDLTFVRHRRPIAMGGQGTLQALIILSGQARLGGETLLPGEAWLLPACLPELALEPQPVVAGLLCSRGGGQC